jgi:hypothetical protein
MEDFNIIVQKGCCVLLLLSHRMLPVFSFVVFLK